MEKERMARLEQAVAEVRAENARLAAEVAALRAENERVQDLLRRQDSLFPEPGGSPGSRRRLVWAWWSLAALLILVFVVPIVALKVFHLNIFESTALSAINALLLYVIGPGVWRLLAEGLVRAIPGVLFGQATRVAWDKWRTGRRKSC